MLRFAGKLFELQGHRTERRSHNDLGGFKAPLVRTAPQKPGTKCVQDVGGAISGWGGDS